MRIHFEDVLEPRGRLDGGHNLQVAYIHQFEDTLLGIMKSHNEFILQDIAQLVQDLCETLHFILGRDDSHDYSDASTLEMRPQMIFRSCHLDTKSMSVCGIRTLFDLRTGDEEELQLADLPNDIEYLNIDVIAIRAEAMCTC